MMKQLFFLTMMLLCISSVSATFFCDVEGQIWVKDRISPGIGVAVNVSLIKDGSIISTKEVLTQDGPPTCDFCDNHYSASFIGDIECFGGEEILVTSSYENMQGYAYSIAQSDGVSEIEIILSSPASSSPSLKQLVISSPGGGAGGGLIRPPNDSNQDVSSLSDVSASDFSNNPLSNCIIQGYILTKEGINLPEGRDVQIIFYEGENIAKVEHLLTTSAPPDFKTGFYSFLFSDEFCRISQKVEVFANDDYFDGSDIFEIRQQVTEVNITLSNQYRAYSMPALTEVLKNLNKPIDKAKVIVSNNPGAVLLILIGLIISLAVANYWFYKKH